MSTVAEQLRQGREARRYTIEQVAEITKIRGDHLRALEAGDYDIFSAPVYIRGFVRTCSTVLNLDVKKVMEDLDGELSQTKKFAEPPSLTGAPRGALDFVMLQFSKITWTRSVVVFVSIVALACLVLGFIAWRQSRQTNPLKDLKPGMYQTPATHPGETLPVPAAPRR